MSCYCGTSKTFELCCAKFIEGTEFAPEPEALMRSRYSAYACKNAQYLFNTTVTDQQKDNTLIDIAQWAAQTKWLKLLIVDSVQCTIENFDSNYPPTVEFTAIYLNNNKLFQFSEKSIFIVEDEQWKYFSGDILTDVQLPTPKRNDLCPCQSGKKFKRCCT